jgi:hypothetical protein
MHSEQKSLKKSGFKNQYDLANKTRPLEGLPVKTQVPFSAFWLSGIHRMVALVNSLILSSVS